MSFNFTRFFNALSWASLLMLSRCGDLAIRRGDATPGVKTLSTASASIADAATLEIENGLLASKANGSSAALVCDYVAATNSATQGGNLTHTTPLLTNMADEAGQSFSTSSLSWMRVIEAKLRLYKAGGPSVNMTAELRNSSGGLPSLTSSLATSAAFDASGIAVGGTGALYTMTFTSSVDITKGEYAIVLSGDANTPVAGNYVDWVSTAANAASCSDSSLFSFGSNLSSNGAYTSVTDKKLYFQLIAATFAPSASASWIMSAYANAVWDVTTFTADENPNGTSGTLTYDIGAGEDPVTPTYSITGKTKAQIQAGAKPVGTYLYLRANFTVASPYHDRAVLGDVSIEAK